MAAGRKNARKADVESKAAAAKAPEDTKTTEKAVDKGDEKPEADAAADVAPAGDVEMDDHSKPEPKKTAKKAAAKKTQAKAKPGRQKVVNWFKFYYPWFKTQF